jgi:prolyl-tRNA editing enzyme YbaK/EbsC (Cys-tRNA(Pro) deacylase)
LSRAVASGICGGRGQETLPPRRTSSGADIHEEAMDSSDLQGFIDQNRLAAMIVALDRPTTTVAAAAAALGVATGQIIKSLVFQVDGAPVLVINNGLARVDKRKLATHYGLARKRIAFARPDQARQITGYVVGGMPPFGHRTQLPTLIDVNVGGLDVVFGGGGGVDAMMRVTTAELLRVTGATLLDLSEREDKR